jgi:hypothetical protein
MKKKIIEHWCLYYFTTKKYFEEKNIKGSNEIAQQLLILQIFLYFGMLFIVPAIFFFFNSSNILKENKWFVSLIIITLFIPIFNGFFENSNIIKDKIKQFESIENWKISKEKKSGQFYFFLHIAISILIGLFYSLIAYLLFLFR